MTTNENPATAQLANFARTFSATARHIVKPEDTAKVLCGGRVSLRERYVGDDGQPKVADSWMVRDLPQCERCAKSATKRGIDFLNA